jgi:hypothetical protein
VHPYGPDLLAVAQDVDQERRREEGRPEVPAIVVTPDQSEFENAGGEQTWLGAPEVEAPGAEVIGVAGDDWRLAESNGLLHLDMEHQFDPGHPAHRKFLEIVGEAALVLDNEVVGADPTAMLGAMKEALDRIFALAGEAPLDEVLADVTPAPGIGDVTLRRSDLDHMFVQHNFGIPIATLFPFYQEMLDNPHMFMRPILHVADGLWFGAWLAGRFAGVTPDQLGTFGAAETVAGYGAMAYTLFAAQTIVHWGTAADGLTKNQLEWLPRVEWGAMRRMLSEEARLWLEIHQQEIVERLAADYLTHNPEPAAWMASAWGHPVTAAELLDRRPEDIDYTLAEFTAMGLVPDPPRTIPQLVSWGMHTAFAKGDTNRGNLPEELVPGEIRAAASPGPSYQWLSDHVWWWSVPRSLYQGFVETRTVVGARYAEPIDVDEAARKLRELSGMVDPAAGGTALLLQRLREGAAELMARLADYDELDLGVLWALQAGLSDVEWHRVVRGAVEAVHERLDARTRARVRSINASTVGLPAGTAREFGMWFPNASVRLRDGEIPAVRYARPSDRYTGANTAPQRVDIRALDRRLDELATGRAGVEATDADLMAFALSVGISEGPEVVQDLRDVAYLTAAVYGPTWTAENVTAVFRLTRLGGDVRRWYELERVVQEVRSAGPEVDRNWVDPGQVQVLADLARGLDGDPTLPGLRRLVEESEDVRAALRWHSELDVFTVLPGRVTVSQIMARQHRRGGRGADAAADRGNVHRSAERSAALGRRAHRRGNVRCAVHLVRSGRGVPVPGLHDRRDRPGRGHVAAHGGAGAGPAE